MNKKDYQKPTMKVVHLQHHQHLLNGSGIPMLTGSQNAYNEIG